MAEGSQQRRIWFVTNACSQHIRLKRSDARFSLVPVNRIVWRRFDLSLC